MVFGERCEVWDVWCVVQQLASFASDFILFLPLPKSSIPPVALGIFYIPFDFVVSVLDAKGGLVDGPQRDRKEGGYPPSVFCFFLNTVYLCYLRLLHGVRHF